jgi:23S rRNA (uracil1939-C5)-methyltransferase
MKFGERIETVIAELDEKGRGIGSFSGKDVIVPLALPGETAVGEFAGKDKGRLKLSNIIINKTSPDRAEPPCPYFGKCGGCALQHLKPSAQSTFKKSLIERAFKETLLEIPAMAANGAGGGWPGSGAPDLSHVALAKWEAGSVAPPPSANSYGGASRGESRDRTRQDDPAAGPGRLVEAPKSLHYRNRMDFVFGPHGELGLKEAGRWDSHVNLESCLLVSKEADECRNRVAAWARATGLPFWDNRKYRGYFRYLVLREGRRTGERMATLVTAAGELPDSARASLVETLAPLCTTIYHGINPKVTDLSLSEELHLLHGAPRLHEKVGGVTYAIHPNSFFQTNTEMAEKLLEHVRGLVLAGPHAKVLDLYCGSGFFSLGLARDADETLGIELDAFAIKSAQENAELNDIRNARFRAEPAETLSWGVEKPDVTIIDPPRSGLHPKVRNALKAGKPPRIIYVSCNPKALAFDLKELLQHYDIASIRAFDLFPQTAHVETVVELRLREPKASL